MAIHIEIPKNAEAIEYLSSFSGAFSENIEMRAALLGMKDSLRQAALLPYEPLGMLACITAEEESATFLYYALVNKGYNLLNFNKLRDHFDKIKFVFFAQALHHYFFPDLPEFPSVVRIERNGVRPVITQRFNYGGFEVIQADPQQTIIIEGEGEAGHLAAVDAAVNSVMDEITPKGFTIKSHLRNVANRRNLCLYGDPELKPRFQSVDEIYHFKSNCVAIVVIGLLVFNSESSSSSMEKLIDRIFNNVFL